ncbi:hypothetical protein NHH03_25530 [Stieleria sp. TO1_6]|uniref:hypothetical protein n=1 Tax=Stieleria tagensis TaxID=2956795 RepID=UPI00209B27F2|nr:hypothetical protein [Stieleria tagensis]MCO8125123.1 hypothetical protein [Stieleria tagensis]
MPLSPYRSPSSRLARRVISTLLLMVFAVGLVGLPIHGPQGEKDGRFPCEHCPCGCATADYCWDKCCCHSDAEKLQWAFENDVTPPDFLVQRASAAATLVAATEIRLPQPNSCCCSAGKSNCDVSPNHSTTLGEPPETDKRSASVRIVLLQDAAKCHGIDLIWSLFSQLVVDDASQSRLTDPAPLLFLITLDDEPAESVLHCPDPPVPWCRVS